eukprot:scaffold45594_cov19-Tisochrysis_lutea.AAC.2
MEMDCGVPGDHHPCRCCAHARAGCASAHCPARAGHRPARAHARAHTLGRCCAWMKLWERR